MEDLIYNYLHEEFENHLDLRFTVRNILIFELISLSLDSK